MHAIVYIIIGIAMSAYSKYIQSLQESYFLELFFWIGLVFILYGLGKLGFRKIMKQQSKPVKKEVEINHLPKNEAMKTCEYCGQNQYASFNTCVRCGRVFRKPY